jgi:hypothetical protein
MESSPIGSLRNRREEIVSSQIMDYKIPRWDNPELHVQFNVVPWDNIDKQQNKLRKLKPADRAKAMMGTSADMLVSACRGIYAVIGGVAYENVDVDKWELIGDAEAVAKWEPRAALTPELAETLGLGADSTARAVMMSLFAADGDLVACGNKLSEFSGWATSEVDDDFLDN